MMKLISLLALGLGLGACVPTTHPTHLIAPSSLTADIRDPRYSTVTAGIRSYDVVEPGDWRELNRRVAPGAGTDPERGDSDDAARRGR